MGDSFAKEPHPERRSLLGQVEYDKGLEVFLQLQCVGRNVDLEENKVEVRNYLDELNTSILGIYLLLTICRQRR